MKIGATFGQLIIEPPTPDHPFAMWMSDVERILEAVRRAEFAFLAFSHYYQGELGYRMQPLVVMSRLAPLTGNLRLPTEILQLPVFNAMDLAYNLATVDHITEGRLDVGIGIGYNPYEIGPAGVSRQDRVPKFEEAVEVMRKFWTGEPVYHQGRFFQVEVTQLQLLPVQRPHPPLWGAAYSHGAAARAGRMLEGLIGGPFQSFEDLGTQVDTFREQWNRVHGGEPDRVGAWRTIIPGTDPKNALDTIIARRQLTFSRNIQGDMQEKTTAQMRLDLTQGDQADWAILGNYQDCLAGLRRCRDEFSLTHVSCNFWNLPEDIAGRCEYLEGFGEEVIGRL